MRTRKRTGSLNFYLLQLLVLPICINEFFWQLDLHILKKKAIDTVLIQALK